ncbi:MFS transporter [Alcaligenes nematophilus]|uniref:MFS transporter n=1 Tax=Alcaligenes nematophilus TaxID=2994643 RepID=A0ABU3MMW7_9BURK|nr:MULTISPECIES: MFS transporter [Alcaligenes]KVX06943.1 hypothetical protein ASL22_11340 [Alcaligenes faecalis]MDK7586661.1 MFS transporter [Alcaligenes phenolicus]MDT8466610.1 MFS transporter [Alcaligenes nematophilus]MDT8469227.1 MFS transporter [Alcaligenes nematophilus]MDT8502862.1 MFS transporter [Alcaligenes nematophilus]
MPSHQTHTDWRAVWVVFITGVACAYNLGKVATAAAHLQSELGLSLAEVGSLGATFAVLGALGSIAAGSAVARAGDRRMLIIGLLTMTTGAVAAVPTNSIVMLMVARTVEGLGFLLITVSGPTLIARITHKQDQGKALALWSCFMPGGMALALLTGPWFSNWRDIWLFTAVLTAMITVLVMRLTPALPTRQLAPAPCARLGHVLSSAPLAITFLLYSLMFFALFSFLPVLLQQRMQASPTTAGMLAALACLANVLGNLCADRILRRVSRRVLCLWVALVMGACAPGIFLPVFGSIPTLALCLLFSAVGGLIPASLLSAVPLVTRNPTQAALAVGLLMQGSNMGVALGPLLVGRAVDGHGWPAAAVLVVAWATAMAFIVGWHSKHPALRA